MTLPWYHKTTIYQIYPRSFYDSRGGGVGDIQGMIQKLDYLNDLGIETIWTSPFFSSPQMDFGYDVSDYMNVAPEYGSMDDALQLIEEVHKRGMKIVFDMVMNHTSIEHAWFRESRSSRDNPKADWYIWRDKPNNWQSMTGGSGWHYAKERGQYYWASFLPFQPDLNYRNPEVKKTMFDIVRFWLKRGVDGYRLDIVNVVYKDAEFRNNPFAFKPIPTDADQSGFFQEAKYTTNQPEAFEFAKELRDVTDEFGDKMTLGEMASSRKIIRQFLGGDKNDGFTLAFDFEMLNFKFSANFFRALIANIEADFPPPFMPVYVFSNLDRRRSAHRLGDDERKAKILFALQLTVRGVPCIYYGEEIGMTNLKLPFATALDPMPHKFKVPRFVPDALGITINRDEVRTPMQWDATRNAGFSSAPKTWLPVNDNYPRVNVKAESEDPDSLLNAVRALLKIRKSEEALMEGALQLMDNLPNNVLGYERSSENARFVVLINFSDTLKEIPAAVHVDGSDEKLECVFKLSRKDELRGQSVRLDGFGGMLLKVKG